MNSNELSGHEWLGVLGAGLIAAAITALALPSPSDVGATMGSTKVHVQHQASQQGALRQGQALS